MFVGGNWGAKLYSGTHWLGGCEEITIDQVVIECNGMLTWYSITRQLINWDVIIRSFDGELVKNKKLVDSPGVYTQWI